MGNSRAVCGRSLSPAKYFTKIAHGTCIIASISTGSMDSVIALHIDKSLLFVSDSTI